MIDYHWDITIQVNNSKTWKKKRQTHLRQRENTVTKNTNAIQNNNLVQVFIDTVTDGVSQRTALRKSCSPVRKTSKEKFKVTLNSDVLQKI